MAPEMLIAPIFFLSCFGMIFGIVYVRNKENMAMIERGIDPRRRASGVKSFTSLKFGLLLCGIGLGLFFAFLIDQFMINHKSFDHGGQVYYRDFPQIYFALIALFGGMGLVMAYHIEKKEWLGKTIE